MRRADRTHRAFVLLADRSQREPSWERDLGKIPRPFADSAASASEAGIIENL